MILEFIQYNLCKTHIEKFLSKSIGFCFVRWYSIIVKEKDFWHKPDKKIKRGKDRGAGFKSIFYQMVSDR